MKTKNTAPLALEKSIRWARFWTELILVAVIYYLRHSGIMFEKGGLADRLLTSLLVFITADLVILFAYLAIVKLYVRRRQAGKAQPSNFVLGMSRITSVFRFIYFIIALSIFLEVNLKETITSLSIIAAAIAILSKDYISNMINGMIIMFSDQISLNDHVKIGAHKGKIMDITFLNVHLINDEDNLIYIPNNTVFATDVLNYTKRVENKVNIDFEMKLANMAVVEEMELFLAECLTDFSDYMVPEKFNLRTVDVKQDFVLMSFQYVIKESNPLVERKIRRKIMRRLLAFLHGRLNQGKE